MSYWRRALILRANSFRRLLLIGILFLGLVHVEASTLTLKEYVLSFASSHVSFTNEMSTAEKWALGKSALSERKDGLPKSEKYIFEYAVTIPQILHAPSSELDVAIRQFNRLLQELAKHPYLPTIRLQKFTKLANAFPQDYLFLSCDELLMGSSASAARRMERNISGLIAAYSQEEVFAYLLSSYFSIKLYLDGLVTAPKKPTPVEFIVTPDCDRRLQAAREQKAREKAEISARTSYTRGSSGSDQGCKDDYFSTVPSSIRWANDNPAGTTCYRLVQSIRELGNRKDFNCNKSLRRQWERKANEASSLNCNL